MANYTITVNFNDTSGDKGYKSPKKKNQEEVEENGSVFSTIGSDIGNSIFSFAEKGVQAYAGIASIATMVEVGKEIFSNYVQRVGRFAGSQQAQDVANASMSIFGKIFRPVSSAINYMFEKEQNQYERDWENIGLQLYRERGGMSINRSRTER